MSDPLAALKDIRFRWSPGQQDVLSIEQFELQKGERVFLKGPSGSGKTTLLGLLGGINVPYQGEISFLNQPLSKMKSSHRDRVRADHIGYIFQLFNLIPYLSVIENIVLSCKFSPVRTERALGNAQTIEDEAMRLLSHLKLDQVDLLARPVQTLSVGQQQRVAVARALIGAPQLIIADEPTSALDAETRGDFIELLINECEAAKSALIFVSHDPTLESFFERSVDLREINRVSLTESGSSE